MFLTRQHHISVQTATDVAAVLLLHSHASFNFFGQVFAVIIVNKITEGHINSRCTAKIIVAVVMVVDRHKTHTQEREDMFQIIANLQIVTPKT